MSPALSKIGDVCEIIAGQHIEAALYDNDAHGTPYRTGPADFGHRQPIVTKWTRHPKVFAMLTDVLITVKGAGTGKSNLGANAAIGRQLMALRPKNGAIDQLFLLYFLQYQQGHINRLAEGATVPGIRKEDLHELSLVLPPVGEQRRIAAILDAADALRQKRRQALRLLHQLTQEIFVEMFGDPIRNERSWPVATVADFVAGFEAGKNLVADDEDDDDAPYRVLKVSAVTSLSYCPEESKPLPRDYDPPTSHIVRTGDLLFSRANTAQLIGATALVTETPDNCVLPDKIWRLVWHDRPRADPYFVWYLFQQRRFRDEISRRATGTSGSMKNISQEKALSIPAALPPLRLQKQFGARATLVSRQRRTYDAAIAKQDRLFASLQHRAFRGEL